VLLWDVPGFAGGLEKPRIFAHFIDLQQCLAILRRAPDCQGRGLFSFREREVSRRRRPMTRPLCVMLRRTPPTRSRRIPPAGFIFPCNPVLVAKPPAGPGWLHEVKHDGFRILAWKRGERVLSVPSPKRSQGRRVERIWGAPDQARRRAGHAGGLRGGGLWVRARAFPPRCLLIIARNWVMAEGEPEIRRDISVFEWSPLVPSTRAHQKAGSPARHRTLAVRREIE